MAEGHLKADKFERKIDFITKQSLRLFVHQGYEGTTVRQIAKACSMTSGTLYHYISAKEDILNRLVSRDLDNIGTLLESIPKGVDPVTSLKLAIERWYRYCDQEQDWVIVSYREIIHMPKRTQEQLRIEDKRARAAFEALVCEAVSSGQLDVDDPTVIALDILSLGQLWALRRWHLRNRYTLEQYIRQQTKLLIDSHRTTMPDRTHSLSGDSLI